MGEAPKCPGDFELLPLTRPRERRLVADADVDGEFHHGFQLLTSLLTFLRLGTHKLKTRSVRRHN